MKIMNHLGILKAMAKAGHIKLHPDTGYKVKHWLGPMVTAYYVDDGPRSFHFKGNHYGVRFFGGCFAPFVVLYEHPEEVNRLSVGFV